MNALLNWWKSHGDKLTGALTTLQAIYAAADPNALQALFGPSAYKWVIFASAAYTSFHTIFIPDAPSTPPPTVNPPKSVTPKLLLWLTLLTVMPWLHGCATFAAPQSLDERIGAAYILLTKVEAATTTASNAHTVSPQAATHVLTIVQQVKPLLNEARMLEVTDPATAGNELTLALTALSALQAYLNAQVSPK